MVLGRLEFAEPDPLAVERDKVPVLAFVIGELEYRGGRLVFGQGGQEDFGGGRHLSRRLAGDVIRVGMGQGGGEQDEEERKFFS